MSSQNIKFDRRNPSAIFEFPLIDSDGYEILHERRASKELQLEKIQLEEIQLQEQDFKALFKR